MTIERMARRSILIASTVADLKPVIVGLLLCVAASVFAQTTYSGRPPAATTPPPISHSQPQWRTLNPAEQAALKPLAARWDSLTPQQKRKWQVVAKNYPTLPATEQAKMHERMAEWAALSPQQRAQARRNFAVNRELTDGLTPEQRQVQWEAYQQLSPAEKRQLAEKAKPYSPSGAAIAAKPKEPLKHQPAPEFGSAKALAKTQAQKAASKPGAKIAIQGAVQPDGSLNPSAPWQVPPATPATEK